MYYIDTGLYECDFCGLTQKFDAHDEDRGDLWGCEKCGRTFCEKCFTDRFGLDTFRQMLNGTLSGPNENDILLCPKCFAETLKERQEAP